MSHQGLESVEQHLDRILAATRAPVRTRVGLDEAAGRTLTAPVLAAVDIPAFRNSAMDGFAVTVTVTAKRAGYAVGSATSAPTAALTSCG